MVSKFITAVALVAVFAMPAVASTTTGHSALTKAPHGKTVQAPHGKIVSSHGAIAKKPH